MELFNEEVALSLRHHHALLPNFGPQAYPNPGCNDIRHPVAGRLRSRRP
jgi:hypothetical protein